MGLSPSKVMGAAGNAWPVPVVAKIIKQIALAMDW